MRTISRYLCMLWIVLSMTYAHAAGLVVTDPGVHAQAVSLLKQGGEALKVAEEQIQRIEKVHGALEGVSNLGRSLKTRLTGYRRSYNKIRRTYPDIFPDVIHSGRIPEFKKPEDIGDIKEILNFTYKTASSLGDTAQSMKKVHRQRSARSALEHAELSLAKTDTKFAELEALAKEMDSQTSIKKSMDMNNKILLQLLASVQELVALNAQLTRLYSAQHYTGRADDQEYKPNELTTGQKAEKAIIDNRLIEKVKCEGASKRVGLCS